MIDKVQQMIIGLGRKVGLRRGQCVWVVPVQCLEAVPQVPVDVVGKLRRPEEKEEAKHHRDSDYYGGRPGGQVPFSGIKRHGQNYRYDCRDTNEARN